jgi:hypothetical protein
MTAPAGSRTSVEKQTMAMQADVETTWDEVKPGSAAHEKLMAAIREYESLQQLAWPCDHKDLQHAIKLAQKPDRSCDDIRYAYELIGEVVDRLRAARDFPEKRERKRWLDLGFIAAMAGSSSDYQEAWLKSAADLFEDVPHELPDDESGDILAHARYAVASLLGALLMAPDEKGEIKRKMDAKFREMFPGVRRGQIINGQFVPDPEPQVIPFPPRDRPEPAP